MSGGYDIAVELMQAELETMRAEVETLKRALLAVGGGDQSLRELFIASVLEAHTLRKRVAACPHCSRRPSQMAPGAPN
jgi:hypothetical protein